jgi:hypothetical protein
MKNTTQDEIELQKNRLEILKMSGKGEMSQHIDMQDDNLYLWQYELEFHKKLKQRERFYVVGGICGIASLIITLALHLTEILSLF